MSAHPLRGLVSIVTGSLSLISAPALARDYGQQGATFPVIEADLLSVIHQRLTGMQETGEIDQANRALAARTAERVRRPAPVAGIAPASEPRSWAFDPTITVADDLRDARGRVIVARGHKRRPEMTAGANRAWLEAAHRRSHRMRRTRIFVIAGLLGLVTALILAAAPARAEGTPGRCTGHFVNPLTDVCWSCLFPMSVGGLNIWPSIAGRPDTDNPALPVCNCGLRLGIAMGFWEPVRLADVSMKPWCFVNLGGMKLDPGFDIGFKTIAGPSAVGGKAQNTSGWHVHWYAYPLIYWMELVTDFLCLEQGSFDILYLTEIDPLWQDSELTAIINPEAVLFANPLALAACAADCVAATAKLPTDPLFWCAGCQGTMYPLNGNVAASIGHVQASRLALARFAYKLHRELVAWGTMGSKGLCGKYLMPVMRKQQYRFQATNPNPQTGGRYACAPIGASTTFMSAGQVYPAIGEDMGYLVWRKRNCCVL